MELHKEAEAMDEDAKAEYLAWLKTRPDGVQSALKDINPFIVHRCKTDRALTGKGTIGTIQGATESGKLIFVAHIVNFGEHCDAKKKETARGLDGPLKVYLDPWEVEPDPAPYDVH
jgi:hypothetical protein